jgi:hypothetical protein
VYGQHQPSSSMAQVSTQQEDRMETFLIGLMVGIIIGRAFDIWVDWKYKK